MITNPLVIVCVLLSLESLVLWLSGHAQTKKYFRVLPHVFWIYFLPMAAATAGLFDAASPVYGWIITYFLPASLFLLLVPVDIRAITRLGGTALLMMLAGTLGTMAGTVAVFTLFRGVVGGRFWSGFGALAGSWTGGSANMIAVKEALHTADDVFLPMVVVDTIVPYAWMGLLVALVCWQGRFDRWVRADQSLIDALKQRVTADGPVAFSRLRFFPALGLVFTALAAQATAGMLPEIPQVVSGYTWTILLVTALGLGLSFTRVRDLEKAGASKAGYFLLYFVLSSIGAKASLSHLGAAVPLVAAGFLLLGVQAVVLVSAAKFLRAPMCLAATASQANVGGVASGPIVAEIYHPGLAPVGLLLAVFGNIVGTYAGILTAQLCRMLV